MARLTVDWKLCQGHRVCAAALPEKIESDRWGYPDIPNEVDIPDHLLAAARVAEATCPAAALRLRAD